MVTDCHLLPFALILGAETKAPEGKSPHKHANEGTDD